MQASNPLLIGQIALELGVITREKLQECLELQAGQPSPRPIGILLVQEGFLTQEQLARVMEEQKRRLADTAPYASAPRSDVSFGRLLVQGGHVTQERVNEALRAQQDLADRGVRKRLGEILVEAGHLPFEVVAVILRMQGKALMSCTFCGTHVNVIRAIAEGYPCRRCGMPLEERAVSASAEDTAYLLPPVDPRITQRAVVKQEHVAAAPVAPPAPARPSGAGRRMLIVLLTVAAIVAAVIVLSKS